MTDSEHESDSDCGVQDDGGDNGFYYGTAATDMSGTKRKRFRTTAVLFEETTRRTAPERGKASSRRWFRVNVVMVFSPQNVSIVRQRNTTIPINDENFSLIVL